MNKFNQRFLAFLLFIIAGKFLNIFSIFVLSDFLHNHDFPIVLYVFTIFCGFGLYQVWLNDAWAPLKMYYRKQVIVNAIGLVLVYLFLFFGLKYSGPLRTLLFQYSDQLLLFLPLLLFTSSLPPNHKTGLLVLLFTYLILTFTTESSPHHNSELTVVKTTDDVNNPETKLHNFKLMIWELSEGAIGSISLFVSVGIDVLRKKYAKRMAKEFGGKRRFSALSYCTGASFLFLFAIAQLYTFTPSVGLPFSNYIALFLFFLVFHLALDSFLEDIIQKHSEVKFLTRMMFFVNFLSAFIIDIFRGEGRLTPVVFASTVAVYFGLYQLQQEGGSSRDQPLLAMYQQDASKKSISIFAETRLLLKHIMADNNTMKIFIFLCINLGFMFVELIYGFWTNSLGLISDAGHMLFDCMALAIGLYASYIAKIKANSIFTYGYSRYEVLSGFVNAIFLVFIGFFVFVESIERLLEAPEILSEKLILVSVLGLFVNLIGLFFFHDSHAHGGHGHSHGHSHSGGSCGGGDDKNLNINVLFLHVLADTLGSLGVIISSVLIHYWGWTRSDAICSIFISVLIVLSVLPSIRDSAYILLQRTPDHKHAILRETLSKVLKLEGVVNYRNAHFWSFTDGELVGTLHVHIKEGMDEQRILNQINGLFKSISISHFTVQIEKEKILSQISSDKRLEFQMNGL